MKKGGFKDSTEVRRVLNAASAGRVVVPKPKETTRVRRKKRYLPVIKSRVLVWFWGVVCGV
jgi:hypothetical protein